jgi:hypothetical protein
MVLKTSDLYSILPQDFLTHHWNDISAVFPYKDEKQCEHRWLFIQKKKGTKVKWTDKEDIYLRKIIVDNKIKGW